MNNQAVQKQVEQLTGIKVNFITPSVGQEADAFTLMISSGELPDIIINPERYPGGLRPDRMTALIWISLIFCKMSILRFNQRLIGVILHE
ncbi:hypothetical protein [Paenibacillus sp. 1A_MP2]|uniref:hypothetical protein n=1 Tax=Paenibacillus sp. 1A_MP2 TaxID=3457495 RepID=UPI003FCD196B